MTHTHDTNLKYKLNSRKSESILIWKPWHEKPEASDAALGGVECITELRMYPFQTFLPLLFQSASKCSSMYCLKLLTRSKQQHIIAPQIGRGAVPVVGPQRKRYTLWQKRNLKYMADFENAQTLACNKSGWRERESQHPLGWRKVKTSPVLFGSESWHPKPYWNRSMWHVL